MSERQKKVLEIFRQVLPEMSREDQSYLLGYGEGIAVALKTKESGDAGLGSMEAQEGRSRI